MTEPISTRGVLPNAQREQVTEITQAHVEQVQAGQVYARQSNIREVHASNVELELAQVGVIHAQKAAGRRVASLLIDGEVVQLNHAMVGLANAEQMSLNGQAAAVTAEVIEAEHIAGLAVAASTIRAGNIRAGILFGRKVEGNVSTLFNGRSALLFGLGIGLAFGLLNILAQPHKTGKK